MEENTRIEFTKEMKKTHTLLFPNMAPIHFKLLQKALRSYGYKFELLTNTGREIVDEGLKYVHNDTCYPALLTTGQMMCALKSGKYDLDRVALVMTQTGGGCRASNYIHLIRKALQKAGMGHIPVLSVNLSGLEKNSGFKITLPLLRRALASIAYGDLLMLLSNQTRPYEINRGETDRLIDTWIDKICGMFDRHRAVSAHSIRKYLGEITASFEAIKLKKTEKVKVGIVGEIYVKYSAAANNSLEKFLADEDCEVMVPGLLGFLLFKVDNRIEDAKLYGGQKLKKAVVTVLLKYLTKFETYLLDSLKRSGRFVTPEPYQELKKNVGSVIGYGCKMGEGWLLTAEMIELVRSGYKNIVCAQPFGCLPNHIVGKGMIRCIRNLYPDSNIVPVDYDPGATKVNQENRIKLMLSVARENMKASESSTGEDITPEAVLSDIRVPASVV